MTPEQKIAAVANIINLIILAVLALTILTDWIEDRFVEPRRERLRRLMEGDEP
jgi:hypothetical protein